MGPLWEWGTLINSQNSPIFGGPGETNLFLPSPAGLMEFPNVLSLVALGGECSAGGMADPGIFPIRTGGKSGHYHGCEFTTKLSFSGWKRKLFSCMFFAF